jgi:hypothetical protein
MSTVDTGLTESVVKVARALVIQGRTKLEGQPDGVWETVCHMKKPTTLTDEEKRVIKALLGAHAQPRTYTRSLIMIEHPP